MNHTETPDIIVFRTRPEDQKQHGIEREIAVSWPLPAWLLRAADECTSDARIVWNTRSRFNPGSEGSVDEPVQVVLGGDGEISVRYHEPKKHDIWETGSLVLHRDPGSWKFSPSERPRPVE